MSSPSYIDAADGAVPKNGTINYLLIAPVGWTANHVLKAMSLCGLFECMFDVVCSLLLHRIKEHGSVRLVHVKIV